MLRVKGTSLMDLRQDSTEQCSEERFGPKFEEVVRCSSQRNSTPESQRSEDSVVGIYPVLK